MEVLAQGRDQDVLAHHSGVGERVGLLVTAESPSFLVSFPSQVAELLEESVQLSASAAQQQDRERTFTATATQTPK